MATTAIFVPLALTSSATGAESAAQGAGGAAAFATPQADGARVPLDQLKVTTTQLASGLERPIAITSPDDGSGRLLVAEKAGMVRTYDSESGLSSSALLDISENVSTSGNERGLLGIAPAPDFAETQTLYVAYTAAPDGTLTLARYSLTGAAQDPVGPAAEEVILTQPHSEHANHNGGDVRFGPDGYLYWSLGDGGGGGDPLNSGQDLGTLLGTIVRIDVSSACGERNYCIPDSNPFVDISGARPEIWAYGLRNPWRFSFDPKNGSLWIGDVGQGSAEEVDRIAAGQGGANFGWSCREGQEVFNQDRCEQDADYVDPIFTYPHEDGNCSITGGRVYRGEQFAEMAGGTYVTADYCSGAAWGIRPAADGNGYTSKRIGELPVQVTTFGVGASGELYVANDLPGRLYRVSFETVVSCSVDYQVNSDWGSGFTASVVLTNTGSLPIEGWTLEWSFSSGQQVTNAWNATLTQQEGIVSASNAAWNRTIEPDNSVRFGFRATYEGEKPVPETFTIDGTPCAVN